MKKVNYLVLLIVVAFMFSGCAVNKAPFQDYPAVTEVQLNQANYRIVGTAQGYSRQVYVFGIGGLSQKSLKENAIMDMYENANLEGSQAIVNITTALTVSGFFPFYASQRASARGTIIEFLQDNEQPIPSVESPYNTTPQRTTASEQKREAQIQSTQRTVNKYYIAWLMKTGKLTTDNKKLAELKNLFSTKELADLCEILEEKELKSLSTGYDKELERYAGRVEEKQQETRVETIVKKLSVDNSPENKYYLAWLIKTGDLTKDQVKLAEIQTVFSMEELAQLSNTSSASELYKNMKGFDTILRTYSIRH